MYLALVPLTSKAVQPLSRDLKAKRVLSMSVCHPAKRPLESQAHVKRTLPVDKQCADDCYLEDVNIVGRGRYKKVSAN